MSLDEMIHRAAAATPGTVVAEWAASGDARPLYRCGFCRLVTREGSVIAAPPLGETFCCESCAAELVLRR